MMTPSCRTVAPALTIGNLLRLFAIDSLATSPSQAMRVRPTIEIMSWHTMTPIRKHDRLALQRPAAPLMS